MATRFSISTTHSAARFPGHPPGRSLRKVAVILVSLMPLAPAGAEELAGACVDERVRELRSSGRHEEALEAARDAAAACAAEPGFAPWERWDAETLVATLERIVALPEEARGDLARADALQATYEQARDAWKLDEAVDAAREQLENRRSRLGEAHPETFDSAVSLAVAVGRTGDLEEGLRLMREAVSLGREVYSFDHPDLARAIDLLVAAVVVFETTAEPRELALEALEMRKRLFGEEHTDVAASMHTLASIMRSAGEAEQRRLHLEALAMRRRLLGREHPDLADSLQRAGNGVGYVMGLRERLLREAVAMRRRLLPENDLRIAESLGSLAEALRWQYDLVEAEELLNEVISIQRAAVGSSHLMVSGTLERLAMMHRFEKEYDKAFPLLQETVAIRTRNLGEDHHMTLMGRMNLALNYAYRGDGATASRMFAEQREAITRQDLDDLDGILDVYMAVAAEHGGKFAEAAEYMVKYVQRFRARGDTVQLAELLRRLGEYNVALGKPDRAVELLTEAASVYEIGRTTMTPGIKSATFQKTPYEQLALVLLERGRTEEAWQAVEAARARVLADLLVAAGTPGAAALADVPFDLERVQAALAPDGAIVGWLDFQLYRDHAASWGYVIRKDRPVRWVRLAAEDSPTDLAERLRAFRDEVEQTAFPLAGRAEPVSEEARRLWQERFAPLERHLDGVERLALIPSWAMGGFPVGALLGDDQRFVGERFEISYVPSASFQAWLKETHRSTERDTRRALLIGDPPFRPEHLSDKTEGRAPPGHPSDVAVLRSALRGDARTMGRLPRLYGSRQEVGRIAPLFEATTILLGPDASEPRLAGLAKKRSLEEYDVVHIATHALVDNEKPERSGLVLSQIGLPDWAEPGSAEAHDGIVTGDEIVETWKLGADLVTLSACQTALGKNVFGEGVVGLSYPFLRAGARSLLLSLWQVDDHATSLLMQRFYTRWLRGSVGKAQALREAKQWLRDYEDDSGRRPYEHPYYWSAFVLLGDSR